MAKPASAIQLSNTQVVILPRSSARNSTFKLSQDFAKHWFRQIYVKKQLWLVWFLSDLGWILWNQKHEKLS
ncbi:MAG: hypothetical protein ACLS36_01705 [Streptococcus sp.]